MLKNRAVELGTQAALASHESNGGNRIWDPYGISAEFKIGDIGPYKHLCAIEASSIDLNRTTDALFLIQRLK